MDKEPEIVAEPEDKHSFNWRVFILWAFVILLFYVLSAGPVVKMEQKGIISPDNKFVKTFYAPFTWAYTHTLLRKPLGMYQHLWVPEWFDKEGEFTFRFH